MDTNTFKVEFILKAIKENKISEVHIWEDRPNQAMKLVYRITNDNWN